MFISVIIPVYQGERYLGLAIESVLAQTHTDFELIIVDDGSTDATPVIAESHVRKDSRVRLIRQRNQNGSGARNTGLAAAKGEWVACLDHDDLMLPHRLECQIAFIREHPDVKAFGSVCQYINQDGLPRGGYTIGAALRSRADLDAVLEKGHLIGLTHPSVMMHRDTIRALGGYNGALEPASDIDLWMRVAQAGHLVLQDDRVLTKYRIHMASEIGANTARGCLASKLVAARAAARREGLPEPTMQEFLAQSRSKPTLQRLAENRQDLGWVYYRCAGTALTNSRWMRGLPYLAAAFCLRPLYVTSRLVRQLYGDDRGRSAEANVSATDQVRGPDPTWLATPKRSAADSYRN